MCNNRYVHCTIYLLNLLICQQLRNIYLYSFLTLTYLTSKEIWIKVSQNLRQKVQDDNEEQWKGMTVRGGGGQ